MRSTLPIDKINFAHPDYVKLMGKDGKPPTNEESWARLVNAFLTQTPDGKAIAFVTKNWRYGLYGAGAYMTLRLVANVIDTYRWWRGSDDARVRARLERELVKYNAAAGRNVDLVNIVQQLESERERNLLVRKKVIKRRQSYSRTRRGSRRRSSRRSSRRRSSRRSSRRRSSRRSSSRW